MRTSSVRRSSTLPSLHERCPAFRGRLVALAAVVTLLATTTVGTVPAVANGGPSPEFSFNNGFLRFGKVETLFDDSGERLTGINSLTTVRESVNAGGLLDTPYYFSSADDRWYQLTFSQRALDLAVGAGRCVGDLIAPPTSSINFERLEAGKCFWHRNTAMASSDGDSVFPYYNAGTSSSSGPGTRGGLESFTRSSTVVNGTGSITTQGSFTIVPPSDTDRFPDQQEYAFSIRHVYELNANATFIRVTTTLTNATTIAGAAAPAPNVNLWVGTRDDYIGSTDRPVKVRGNITGSGFVPLDAADESSNAIKVYSGNEGILFYSTTPGVNTVFADCCGFYDEILPVPPAFSGNTESDCRPGGVLDAISCNDLEFDGSYAIVLPIGDMAAGAARTIVWYYAAGPVAALGAVAEQLATDSTVSTVSTPTSTTSAPVPDPEGGLPSVAPGQSSGSVAGVATVPSSSIPAPGSSQYQVGTSTIRLDLAAGQAGAVSGPASAPVLRATSGGFVGLSGSGMQPGTSAQAWVVLPGGGSRQVGVAEIGSGGGFSSAIALDGRLDGGGPLPIGTWTLQVYGTDAEGRQTVLNVGIRIEQRGPDAPEPDRSAGSVPTLRPGGSLATNAGLPTPVTVTPLPGSRTTIVQGDGWLMDIGVPNGRVGDSDGAPLIEIVRESRTVVSGTGFLPGTRARVWLMSTPRFLGEVTVAADGTFRGDLPVTGVTLGQHTLQVSGVGTDGYIRAANLGVIVTGGTPLPARINAGEGPMPLVPLTLALVIALMAIVVSGAGRERAFAAVAAERDQRERRARTIHGRRLTGFDDLHRRLDDGRRALRDRG